MVRAVQQPPTERVSDEHVMEIVASREEIDELGHVSNITYVKWIQEVAKSHSQAVGWDYDRYFAAGMVFVVRRHEIEYVVPAMEGDAIRLRTWVASWRGASSERHTRIERLADGRELARGVTQWVLVATSGGRPKRIPPEIVTAFTRRAGA